jgi:hypothetical protein
MPVETPSLFSRIIQEHLELKRRNAALDGDMPLARYMVDDPFSNHPLFKSEEQARLEDTMDGISVGDVTMLLNIANEDTAEHIALSAHVESAPEVAAATAPARDDAETEDAEASGSKPAPGPAPGMLPSAIPPEESSWGQSRDFDWGD